MSFEVFASWVCNLDGVAQCGIRDFGRFILVSAVLGLIACVSGGIVAMCFVGTAALVKATWLNLVVRGGIDDTDKPA